MNINDFFTQNHIEFTEVDEKKKDIVQLVIFKLANEEYAVDVSQVVEIKKITTITRVPKAKSYFIGVINLRGSVIPIVDFKKIINVSPTQSENSNRIIILKINKIMFGIVVDSVSEVVDMDKEDIEDAGKIDLDLEKKYISGIGKYNNRLLIILNLMKIAESTN